MKDIISTIQDLRKIYDQPKGRTKDKVLAELEKHAIHFISCSPFVLVSTVNTNGKMDVSPRGGAAGFVHIENPKTLILPDYKGNNRLDSLTNIIETGSVGMLFLIPGVDETLRINGRAKISIAPEILSKFDQENKPPISAIVIELEEVFLHCAKALMRSHLWDARFQIERDDFPSMGQMLKDQMDLPEPPESREDMLKRYRKDL